MFIYPGRGGCGLKEAFEVPVSDIDIVRDSVSNHDLEEAGDVVEDTFTGITGCFTEEDEGRVEHTH